MIKVIVEGKVQGVGYRYYVLKSAQNLGIFGYVKNLPNGEVQVVFQNSNISKEKSDNFIDLLKQGSFHSEVQKITLENSTEQVKDIFEVRY